MKKAFTLIEVNLAMMIMAGGILSVVGLYALGFRENAQSTEDVAGAAMADTVMGPLVMALSATNITWDAFNSLQTYPQNGWAGYLNAGDWEVISSPKSTAQSVYNSVMSGLSGLDSQWRQSFPGMSLPQDYEYALVVNHEEGSGVVSLAFRSSRKAKLLMSQPLYYTEVRFQGAGRR